MSSAVERETGSGTDLWRVVLAPTIWAVHFLVCYVGAAVYCAKAGRVADADPARFLVAAVTVFAVAGLALVFRSLWRVRGLSIASENFSYSANTPEERHRFLSHVALMLCVLSLVGVLFVAIPAVVIGTCR